MAVHIAGVGARTSVGLYAGACAASVRAGVAGIELCSTLVDRIGDPVRFGLDKNLDSALVGSQRLVALAWAAAAEIFDQNNSQRPFPPMQVFVGLPEYRPGWSVSDSNVFQTELHRRLGSLFPVERIEVMPKGHASGLLALDAGCKVLESGRAEFCLVGGVDSYYHADTIDWLLDHHQLATAEYPGGFIPGEASGFLLLATQRALARYQMPSEALIVSRGTAVEPCPMKTETVCIGQGLTEVYRQATSGLREGEKVSRTICDINGERYRSVEFPYAILRVAQPFVDAGVYDSPADCWGDVGAASGPLFALLAIAAAQRGYAKGPHTLIWGSSEGGDRAGALLRCD